MKTTNLGLALKAVGYAAAYEFVNPLARYDVSYDVWRHRVNGFAAAAIAEQYGYAI